MKGVTLATHFMVLFAALSLATFMSVDYSGTGFAVSKNITNTTSKCGNGVINIGEQCDGANLGGRTCKSFGYAGGTLSCTSNCRFNTSGCSTVANNTPPIVSAFHAPPNPRTTSMVTINANASDPNGIASTIIYVDDVLRASCNSARCVYNSKYPAGVHNYYATAKDRLGAVGASITRIFNVSDTTNGTKPPVNTTPGNGTGGSPPGNYTNTTKPPINNTNVSVSEYVKCVFNGSASTQTCYSGSYNCSGYYSCSAYVKGTKGTVLTWKSTCSGSRYTTIDGVDEYAYFNCGNTTNTTLSITVKSPNGGETWKRGTYQNISWSASGFTNLSKVRIELLNSTSNSHVSTICGNCRSGLSGGSYRWFVSSSVKPNSYFVKVITQNAKPSNEDDMSDGTFKIV